MLWYVVTAVNEIDSFETLEDAKKCVENMMDPDGENLKSEEIALFGGTLYSVSRNTTIKVSEIKKKKKAGKPKNEKK
jgi:hypothetical protein